MKKLTIIGAIIALAIVGVLLLWRHKTHSSIPPKMDMRVYTLRPDVFFGHLNQQLTPKDGETHSQLLLRYFEEHHLDIQKPPDSLFVSDEKGLLFVKATGSEQAAVEKLVLQLNNP